MGRGVAAGFPVLLLPALLDHVMSFLLLYGVTRYLSWSDSHEVTTFLTLDNVYILLCTDCLVLSDVYIPLVVRIGLFRPNKRQFTSGLHLTPKFALRGFSPTSTVSNLNSNLIKNGRRRITEHTVDVLTTK